MVGRDSRTWDLPVTSTAPRLLRDCDSGNTEQKEKAGHLQCLLGSTAITAMTTHEHSPHIADIQHTHAHTHTRERETAGQLSVRKEEEASQLDFFQALNKTSCHKRSVMFSVLSSATQQFLAFQPWPLLFSPQKLASPLRVRTADQRDAP